MFSFYVSALHGRGRVFGRRQEKEIPTAYVRQKKETYEKKNKSNFFTNYNLLSVEGKTKEKFQPADDCFSTRFHIKDENEKIK